MKREGYVGKTVKGFKFPNIGHPGYVSDMDHCVGVEGTITRYTSEFETFTICFGSVSWSYPAKLVVEQIENKNGMKKEEKIKRLKWMLEAVYGGELDRGLCDLYKEKYRVILTDDMPEIVPEGKSVNEFWFPAGEEEPKVEFLREWIDKLSGEKSVVEQLVDNVNQNGGEIFGLKVGDKLPEGVINAWSGKEYNYSVGAGQVAESTLAVFARDREIKSFSVVGGEVFFEVSGTVNVYLRAEGYKKFAGEFQTPQQTYSIGQRFRSEYTRDYILAAVSQGKVGLINLEAGSRWAGPVSVEDKHNITQKEFKSVTGGAKMTLIDEK